MEDVSDLIRLCFPVAPSELQTNKNIPLDHVSPINPRYRARLFQAAIPQPRRDAAPQQGS
jgi:hypothetical protein